MREKETQGKEHIGNDLEERESNIVTEEAVRKNSSIVLHVATTHLQTAKIGDVCAKSLGTNAVPTERPSRS